jgi:hypothetical protein
LGAPVTMDMIWSMWPWPAGSRPCSTS